MTKSTPLRRRERAGPNHRAERGARKLRRAAEAGHPGVPEDQRPDSGHAARDTKSVDAHNELLQPEHSKGRPPPSRKGGPSNSGNDGP